MYEPSAGRTRVDEVANKRTIDWVNSSRSSCWHNSRSGVAELVALEIS
jgi:hypothetical protein